MLTSLLLSAAMTVSGAHAHDRVGSAIASAGDVNGDVIVGDPNGGAGHAYVVFGTRVPADVNVDALGTQGFAMAIEDQDAGFSVAGVGDMNGDGHADLVFGSFARGAGAAYVVFGRSHATLDLTRIVRRGVRLPGRVSGARLGWSVAGVPNSDGRGHDGILVGSPHAQRGGETSVGAASLYVSRRRAG